jgi:hypothetical protein
MKPILPASAPLVSILSLKSILKLVFYFALGWQFGMLFWWGQNYLFIDRVLIYGQMAKPYVYRQLVPLLARLLIWMTDTRVDIALVAVIALSAVAAILALGAFLEEFEIENSKRKEVIGAVVLFVLLVKDAKIYDFATVAMFTICLILLHRRKFWWYQVAFLLACINRETTFLLILFFAFHFFGALGGHGYFTHLFLQALMFVSVRIGMLVVFWRNPGTSVQFNFFQNLQDFANHPINALVVLVLVLSFGWLIIKNWLTLPKFLQDVVITFTPPLFVMYFLFGHTLELRVFLELFPVLFLVAVAGWKRVLFCQNRTPRINP